MAIVCLALVSFSSSMELATVSIGMGSDYKNGVRFSKDADAAVLQAWIEQIQSK